MTAERRPPATAHPNKTTMRKHITFAGLTSNPTDHESADGQCAALVNLIAEDEALRPIGLHLQALGLLPHGSRLAGAHATSVYRHLIIEVAQEAQWTYLWTTPPTSSAGDEPIALHPLYETAERVNAFTSMGDTLCMVTDSATLYALWDEDEASYCVVSHSDLRYDITLTQDVQQRREVTLPISGALATYLDAPTTAVANRQSVVAQMLPGFYDSDDAYATGATMVAAMMAAATDHEAALMGQGTHKYIRFGVAILRMADGNHLLCSNLFALLPADLPTRITADREAGMLSSTVYLHRHTLTIDMRQPAKAARVVTSVDIYLSRELHLLDLRQAATIVADMEGKTTSLTFAPLSRQATLEMVDRLPFYKVLTVGPAQWGQPVMVPQGAEGEKADLSDLRRWQAGARVADCHDGRLSIGAVARTLFSPFESGLTYRYLTLDAASRQALGPDEREQACTDELVAGSRADLSDQPLGQVCDIVVRARLNDPTVHEAWWSGQVQYPIPGMMMAPYDEVEQLTYYVRLTTTEGTRYYITTQHMDTLRQKGLRLSVHTATGQAHRVERAALHSLLLQQARVLHLDDDTGEYQTTYLLWQPSTAEEWEAQREKAREAWTLTRSPSLLRTSAKANPFVFPQSLAVDIGDGEMTRLMSNTRRTADGLFGDGQYYAFTSKGLWVLRLSGERWQAQQTVSRDSVGADAPVVATDDAVVYASSRGLMMVRGGVGTCLSDALRGTPFACSTLPHFSELVSTEPTLAGQVADLPPLAGTFLSGAQVMFDSEGQRLWLHHPNHPHLALVYSLRSKQWGTAVVAFDSSISNGDATWALQDAGDAARLVSVAFHGDVHARQPVLLCSRPLSLGLRHVLKTAHRVMVRGLFGHQGPTGSYVGMALYGSNDLASWHYIGSSANQYMRHRRGTPYKWFCLVAIGRILPGESIEGVSMEFAKRFDNKVR